MSIKLHRFRDYVERGDITIHTVSTHNQRADYLTKFLDKVTHKKHRKKVQGWQQSSHAQPEGVLI